MSSENWPDRIGANELTKLTLKMSTEELIRQSLLNGEMKPGEIYSANALAKHLGTSNSPVREAMISLVHRGLLELVRNRGFRVVEMTEKDRREVYALREMVEVEAVRQLAEVGITAKQGHKLHELAVASLTTLTDTEESNLQAYLQADDRFHLYMIGLLGNHRLEEIVNNLRDQSRINGVYHFLLEEGLLLPSAQEHIAMATAIVSRDAEKAASIMLNHLAYAHPMSKNVKPAPANSTAHAGISPSFHVP